VRIPTPKKIPPSLKEYSVGQLSKDYLPIITTTTTTTTTYTHLILATLSFYFWPMPIFFCRMPNFMRPGLGTSHKLCIATQATQQVLPELGSIYGKR
jgi:hypothetical protein